MPFSLKFLSLIKHGTVDGDAVKQPLVSSLSPFSTGRICSREQTKK